MTYKQLWKESSSHLQQYPNDATGCKLFSNGARWMHERMDIMNGTSTHFNERINFVFYGWFKYSVSVAVSIISALLLYQIFMPLILLSLFVFYFCEVQFVFLFPLLIDGVPKPLSKSIKITSRVGSFKAMMIVVPIGLLMLWGLFNLKAPLRNWYTGCLAILIWYQYEIRNRLK